jgi:integrase
MANIQERRNKNGNLISFSIRIFRGRDKDGRQLAPYSETFVVPDGWTESRARKEAEKRAILAEKGYKEGSLSDNRQTFTAYAEYAISLKEQSGIKHSTIVRYRGLMDRLNPAIGHFKLKDIRPQHLNKLYAMLSEDGQNQKTGGKLSPKTVLEYHRLVSTILAQAEREMLIPFNPARKSTPPKMEKPVVNFFQIDQVRQIAECLDAEPIKWRTIVHLLMLSGCRRGEILGLQWQNIDLQAGILRIRNNLQYSKERGLYDESTKSGKARTVKIQPETVVLLKQYKAWQSSERLKNGDRWILSDYVFTREAGGAMHPDSITDWLDKFGKRHNLPHINPHAFRHTYASILISQGIDIATISKTLGHEKVSTTTDFYAQLMEEASEKASETIVGVILNRKGE